MSKPPLLQSPTPCSFPPPAWATDNLTSTKLCRPGWKHSKTTHSFNFAEMPVQVSPGQAFFLLDHFLPASREVAGLASTQRRGYGRVETLCASRTYRHHRIDAFFPVAQTKLAAHPLLKTCRPARGRTRRRLQYIWYRWILGC